MPRFIVCVPVFNEEKTINKTINSILNQIKAPDFEIIIISSGSTDNTNKIIKNISKANYNVNIIIEQNRTGKAVAINHLFKIIEKKNFEYVIFLDGDVLINEDSFFLIDNYIKKFPQHDLITFHPIPINSDKKIFSKLAKVNCRIWDETRKYLSKNNSVWPVSGYFFCIKKESIPSSISKLDIIEDTGIGIKLLSQNKSLSYYSNVKVKVKFPNNIKDYYNQKTRTRNGWNNIRKKNRNLYNEMVSIQRKIIFSHVKNLQFFYLFAWIIHRSLLFISMLTKDNNEILWKKISSTKDL